jgi:4-aminobutyrate aminotransferase
MEPIQGEGGYRFPSEAFTDEIAALAAEHDITVIADEIQTGVGRTGEMWGSDHYAYDPDVIASAKGLRVGATVSRSDVFPEETGRISSTWGAGDVIAAAQGALTLDAIEEADLMDNAVVRGRQFTETMRDADLNPVEDVRGKGLLLAVEFDTKERRDAVVKHAFSSGLLTLACGHKVLRILPPLDVTEREIDLGADLLTDAIEAAA